MSQTHTSANLPTDAASGPSLHAEMFWSRCSIFDAPKRTASVHENFTQFKRHCLYKAWSLKRKKNQGPIRQVIFLQKNFRLCRFRFQERDSRAYHPGIHQGGNGAPASVSNECTHSFVGVKWAPVRVTRERDNEHSWAWQRAATASVISEHSWAWQRAAAVTLVRVKTSIEWREQIAKFLNSFHHSWVRTPLQPCRREIVGAAKDLPLTQLRTSY